jgi:hypothetical protein
MPSAVPTRRSVLRGIAGLGLGVLATGCTSAPAADSPSPQGEPDRVRAIDLAVVDSALAASQDLAKRYAATLTAFPELAGVLAPLEAEHAAHIAALDTTPASAPGAASTESTAPTPPVPTGSAVPSVPSVPAIQRDAVAALTAAERASAAARVADLLASSPAVARLLASIAACQATHAAVLGDHR